MTTLIEPLSGSFAANPIAVVAARHRQLRDVAGATAAAMTVSITARIALARLAERIAVAR